MEKVSLKKLYYKNVLGYSKQLQKKIINGEAEGDFLYQGKNVVAFKDINPSAPVHILVVPRKHIRSINDLEEEDASLVSEMLYRAKDIAEEQGMGKAGYKLIFNVEKGGGTIRVPHTSAYSWGMDPRGASASL